MDTVAPIVLFRPNSTFPVLFYPGLAVYFRPTTLPLICLVESSRFFL